MTKPFHRQELVARIHAIVRRSKGHAQSTIATGRFTVNLDAQRLSKASDGVLAHLTAKEYQKRQEFFSACGGERPAHQGDVLDHLYGGMDEPELKIIDVFICKLRKKLSEATGGENYIETVWGRAMFSATPQAARRNAGWRSGPKAPHRRFTLVARPGGVFRAPSPSLLPDPSSAHADGGRVRASRALTPTCRVNQGRNRA